MFRFKCVGVFSLVLMLLAIFATQARADYTTCEAARQSALGEYNTIQNTSMPLLNFARSNNSSASGNAMVRRHQAEALGATQADLKTGLDYEASGSCLDAQSSAYESGALGWQVEGNNYYSQGETLEINWQFDGAEAKFVLAKGKYLDAQAGYGDAKTSCEQATTCYIQAASFYATWLNNHVAPLTISSGMTGTGMFGHINLARTMDAQGGLPPYHYYWYRSTSADGPWDENHFIGEHNDTGWSDTPPARYTNYYYKIKVGDDLYHEAWQYYSSGPFNSN